MLLFFTFFDDDLDDSVVFVSVDIVVFLVQLVSMVVLIMAGDTVLLAFVTL